MKIAIASDHAGFELKEKVAPLLESAGHEVVVFSQEPHPEAYDLGGATTVRPKVDGPLPVFVLDRYAASLR